MIRVYLHLICYLVHQMMRGDEYDLCMQCLDTCIVYGHFMQCSVDMIIDNVNELCSSCQSVCTWCISFFFYHFLQIFFLLRLLIIFEILYVCIPKYAFFYKQKKNSKNIDLDFKSCEYKKNLRIKKGIQIIHHTDK